MLVSDRSLIMGRGYKGKKRGSKTCCAPISTAKTSSYHVKITSKLVVPREGGGDSSIIGG